VVSPLALVRFATFKDKKATDNKPIATNTPTHKSTVARFIVSSLPFCVSYLKT
jgi:hypothetical protein